MIFLSIPMGCTGRRQAILRPVKRPGSPGGGQPPDMLCAADGGRGAFSDFLMRLARGVIRPQIVVDPEADSHSRAAPG